MLYFPSGKHGLQVSLGANAAFPEKDAYQRAGRAFGRSWGTPLGPEKYAFRAQNIYFTVFFADRPAEGPGGGG